MEIGELYFVCVEWIFGVIDEIDGCFVVMGSKLEGVLCVVVLVVFGFS